MTATELTAAEVALTGEQILATLPRQLQTLVLAHAADVVSNPITDKRYVELSRSGEVVAEYLIWKRASGATSAASEYEVPLARMCMFQPDFQIEDWDAGTLLRFVTEYQTRYGLADQSLRTKLYVPVRDFFKWAVPWKRLTWNPADMLPKPRKVRPKVLDTFTFSEQAKLLLAAERGMLPKRDKAALLLLFDTGARKNDLQELQWRDVNLADKIVVFRYRKGDKEQALEFSDRLQQALMDAFYSPYPIPVKLEDAIDPATGRRRPQYETAIRKPGPDDYLMFPVGVNGGAAGQGRPSWIKPWKPVSESTLQNWWGHPGRDDGIIGRAGIPYRKLHMTRHTHGTELYEATSDIAAVADRLGHESLETARIYVHNSRKHRRASLAALEAYRQAVHEKDI